MILYFCHSYPQNTQSSREKNAGVIISSIFFLLQNKQELDEEKKHLHISAYSICRQQNNSLRLRNKVSEKSKGKKILFLHEQRKKKMNEDQRGREKKNFVDAILVDWENESRQLPETMATVQWWIISKHTHTQRETNTRKEEFGM